jgi:hypothetical protein
MPSVITMASLLVPAVKPARKVTKRTVVISSGYRLAEINGKVSLINGSIIAYSSSISYALMMHDPFQRH